MSKRRVAFQGRPGAYSESACYHLCGRDIDIVPCNFFEEIYEAVRDGKADYGVIPIENTTTGSVYQNYTHLLHYKIPIVGEVKLRIEHTLMAHAGATIDSLRQVLSHEQAIGQCSSLFIEHPHIAAKATFDTAGSAEMIAKEHDLTLGAIASGLAAKKYGLEILKRNVENQSDTNYTRFVGIQREAIDLTDISETKTTIVYTPKEDHPGLLHEVLGLFADNDVDLVKIESRPKPGNPFEYIFHLDLKGDTTQQPVRQAIEQLKTLAEEVHILGSYPTGEFKQLIEE
ncbi:MAG: ACT domain-containing protein [Fibrobacterales bacterium]